MQHTLFFNSENRKIAIGFINYDKYNNLYFNYNCLFQIRDITNHKKHTIITYDLEGRLLNIKLGRSGDDIEVKMLERSFDGTYYIYTENLKNLSFEHDFLYIYYDYYEEIIARNTKESMILITQVSRLISLIVSSNFQSSNTIEFFSISNQNHPIGQLPIVYALIIRRIMTLYTYDGLSKEKILFNTVYSTTLNVLPPEVRPDLSPEFAVVQMTHGCKFKCTKNGGCNFCGAYLDTQYYEKNEFELKEHIKKVKDFCKLAWTGVTKFFLSDADPLNTEVDSEQYFDIINNELQKIVHLECFITTSTILSKNKEKWQTLKNKGLKKLYWGVESADDEVLKLLGKPHNYTKLRDAATLLNDIGLEFVIILMSGIGALEPERNKNDILENNHISKTVKFIEESHCKEIYLSKFTPVVGTKLYEAMKSNRIKLLDNDEFELQHRTMIKLLSAQNRAIKGSYGIQFIS
jgi:radical SAM superfamily enzyme YgiQ (UPF0313 family)